MVRAIGTIRAVALAMRLFTISMLLSLVACSEGSVLSRAPDHSETSDEVSSSESEARSRCGRPAADEPVLYSSDLSWGQSPGEMADLYEAIYSSGKRLPERAFYDEHSGSFVLPIKPVWGERVFLSTRLISSVRDHLELALSRRYADFPFFSDMGHSHLLIPEEHWLETYEPLEVAERSILYTQLFDDAKLRVLYHTAEQLEQTDDDGRVIDDRYLQWRFYTRNIVGDNRGGKTLEVIKDLGQRANTARDLEGHVYFGAGFNVSASKDGCFPFTIAGETRYFDLSLSDLEADPSIPIDPT